MLDQKKSEIAGMNYIIGGYRVKFTNWNAEEFFATKEDAQDFANKYTDYGYNCAIDTIYFKVSA